MEYDDDVDFFFTGEEMKNMTEKFDNKMKDQEQQIERLKKENQQLRTENDQLKQQLQKKQNQILKNGIDIVKCMKEKSEIIEENSILRATISKQNLSDVINLFSWKSQSESDKMILQLKQQTIKLEQQLKNGNIQSQVHDNNLQNSIEYQNNIIEQLQNEIKNQEFIIKQNKESQKEMYYIAEVVMNYIESLNQHERQLKIKHYIDYIAELLNQIFSQNNIRHKIVFQNLN